MEVSGRLVRSAALRAAFMKMLHLSLIWIAALFSITAYAADTQKPTVPTALAATAVSSNQVNLNWTASTDNIGVTGYQLQRCTGATCTNFVLVATVTGTSYSDAALVAATAYRYRVRATDAVGNLSAFSTVVGVTTLPDTQAPTAPTNLVATASSGTKIVLTWSAATDNTKVTGYLIEQCAGVACSNFTQIATTTTALTYSNTGLTNTTSYSYRVRATDAAANLSNYSAIATASTLDTTKPTAPTALTGNAVSAAQINLSWTASTDNLAVTGYHIERCTGSSCTTYAEIGTSITTGYNDTGLTGATAYRYRVRTNDAAGNLSSYSSIITKTTLVGDTQAPTIPSGLTATATSSTQINLSWTASTDNVGVAAYLLERCSGASCSTYTQIASVASTAYSDSALTASTSYSYRVRATDAANNQSGYSSTATAATQYAGPITFTYTYDALGRITRASGSNGTIIDYSYDANGNVTTINRQ